MTADLKNFVFPEQALLCPHALERGILRAKRHPWELSSRHKSPPMLLASSRDKASPSPTPGCFPAASSADLEKGRNSFPFRESEMPFPSSSTRMTRKRFSRASSTFRTLPSKTCVFGGVVRQIVHDLLHGGHVRSHGLRLQLRSHVKLESCPRRPGRGRMRAMTAEARSVTGIFSGWRETEFFSTRA